MKGVAIDRKVLLYELERRCSFADCNGRVRIGLTKDEIFEYDGFECEVCSRWTADTLTQKDVPDWWSDLEERKLDFSDADVSLE